MKTAVIPQVRVEPELRAELDAVLTENETLSGFVEAAVGRAVEHRRVPTAFHALGPAAFEHFQRTGISHNAKDWFDSLQAKLDARRSTQAGSGVSGAFAATSGRHRRVWCSPRAVSSGTTTTEPLDRRPSQEWSPAPICQARSSSG
jgi:hypothetical protein